MEWARSRMPVLAILRKEAERTKPLAGQRVAGCLHVTKETAVLIETIVAAGAEVSWSVATHFRLRMMSRHGWQARDMASTHGMDNPWTISMHASIQPSNSSQP